MKRDGISVPRPSAKPWEALGISRRTYYRHKAAGTLPRSIQIPAGSAIDGIDFAKFGITAIRLMRGTDVVQAWMGAERVKRDGAMIRKGETGGFAGATPPPDRPPLFGRQMLEALETARRLLREGGAQ